MKNNEIKSIDIDEKQVVLEYRGYVITSDRNVWRRKGNKLEECNPNDTVANFLKDACKQPERYDFTSKDIEDR